MRKYVKKFLAVAMLCLFFFTLIECNHVEKAEGKTTSTKDKASREFKLIHSHTSHKKSQRTYKSVEFGYVYDMQTGKGRLYSKVNGKKTILATEPNLDAAIVTDGKVVYYTISEFGGSARFYKTNVDGSGTRMLKEIKAVETISFAECYGNRIFFVDGIDPGTLYTFNVKNYQIKKVADDVTTVQKYGKYLYLMPYCGDATATNLRVLNIQTGKISSISDELLGWDVVDGHLYYAEQIGFNSWQDLEVKVIRCSYAGTKKKTMIKSVNLQYVKQFKKDKLVYIDKNGKQRTRKYSS